MLSFFPQGVLDEILNLIESVSEGFPSYSTLREKLVAFRYADTCFGMPTIMLMHILETKSALGNFEYIK